MMDKIPSNKEDTNQNPSTNRKPSSTRPQDQQQQQQQQQALKCPRCDSPNTKFCYYNNYSLSQPRYFCKTCRRYWTKGGTLRNIPVGGGCRKNKKVSSKKSNDHHHHNHQTVNQIPGSSSSTNNPIDLHLTFPEIQYSQHFGHVLGHNNPNFLDPRPIDFMESKLEGIVGNNRNSNYDFMEMGLVGGGSGGGSSLVSPNVVHGLCSPFGMSMDGNNGNFMDTCQRLMLPYDANDHQDQTTIDVKPNTKLLSLDWQDQGCSDVSKDTFGYNFTNLGSWTGMMNNYGSSTTNSLV